MSAEVVLRNNQIVRIDKSLSSIRMFSHYKDSEHLLRDIIIFLARNYQQDLFNYTIFDPTEFYKLLKWNRTSLSRSIPVEDLDKEFPDINDHIGQALLKLFRTHIEVPIEESSDKWGAWGRGIKKVVIIEEITPTKNKMGKKLYKLKIAESFKQNLNNFYFQININTYANLKVKNSNTLQELYLFSMTLKNKLLNNKSIKEKLIAGVSVIESSQHFNKLAEIAGIGNKNVRQIKQDLIRAFKRLNLADPEFKIHLTFNKGPKANFAFCPVLKFELMPISTEEKGSNRLRIFISSLRDILIKAYRLKNNSSDILTIEQEAYFETWICATNPQMVKIRTDAFVSAYNTMMPFPIDNNHPFAIIYGKTTEISIAYTTKPINSNGSKSCAIQVTKLCDSGNEAVLIG